MVQVCKPWVPSGGPAPRLPETTPRVHPRMALSWDQSAWLSSDTHAHRILSINENVNKYSQYVG